MRMSLTLSVAPGEILALLGPNGAGKTTTVRMLAAILAPTSGQAFVAGRSVIEEPQEVRRRVGLLTEHPGLYLFKVSDYNRNDWDTAVPYHFRVTLAPHVP